MSIVARDGCTIEEFESKQGKRKDEIVTLVAGTKVGHDTLQSGHKRSYNNYIKKVISNRCVNIQQERAELQLYMAFEVRHSPCPIICTTWHLVCFINQLDVVSHS